jgi:lysophospholipase L1-like esterase
MTRNGVFWLGLGAFALFVAVNYGDGPAPPGNLLVIGDSLTAQSRVPIKRVLNDEGWSVTVVAEPGSGIAGGGQRKLDWSSILHERVARLDPEVVYIELGTNGCGPGCTTVPDEIDALLDELRSVPVVLWLDVRTNVPLPHADPPAINRDIHAATLRYPNVTRLEFDEWGSADPGLLVGDGVHFNVNGQLVMADQVRRAVRAHTG